MNAAKCPVRHQQRDGAMAFNGNFGAAHNYDPSSIPGAPAQNPEYRRPPLPLCGEAADHYDHRIDGDYHSQAGALYRLLPAAERDRLTSNIARAMLHIPTQIIERQIAHFEKADADYGKRVLEKLTALATGSLTRAPAGLTAAVGR